VGLSHFQFDVDERGRAIKIASIVDEHTRECIGGLVERSITADRLTNHLDDLVAIHGAPAVLNINSFYSLLHAQVVISDWKIEYNTVRRHSALGYLTPADYARHCTHKMETDDSHNDRT